MRIEVNSEKKTKCIAIGDFAKNSGQYGKGEIKCVEDHKHLWWWKSWIRY